MAGEGSLAPRIYLAEVAGDTSQSPVAAARGHRSACLHFVRNSRQFRRRRGPNALVEMSKLLNTANRDAVVLSACVPSIDRSESASLPAYLCRLSGQWRMVLVRL